MEYPKEVMKKSELVKLGISKTLLDEAYRDPKQTFANKANPLKRNSPISYVTAEFEKWRLKQIRLQRVG